MRQTHTRPQRTDDPWGRYAYATNNSNPGSVSPISAPANPRPDARTLTRPRGKLKEGSGRLRNMADLRAYIFIWSAAVAVCGIFLTLIVLGHS